jgi:hypothetical protein
VLFFVKNFGLRREKELRFTRVTVLPDKRIHIQPTHEFDIFEKKISK